MQFLDDFQTLDFHTLQTNSFVCIDDYVCIDSKTRKEFLSIINYVLRHKKITLFIIMHSIYLSNHFSEMLICPHIFLTNSPASSQYVTKMKKVHHEIQKGYDYIREHDYVVLYANKNRSYAISILSGFVLDKMWTFDNKMYVIHDQHASCQNKENDVTDLPWFKELLDSYSKHKKKILVLIHLLLKNDFLQDTNSLLVGNKRFTHKIHLIDFFSMCLSVQKLKLDKKKISFFKSLFTEATYTFPQSVFPLYIRKYMK